MNISEKMKLFLDLKEELKDAIRPLMNLNKQYKHVTTHNKYGEGVVTVQISQPIVADFDWHTMTVCAKAYYAAVPTCDDNNWLKPVRQNTPVKYLTFSIEEWEQLPEWDGEISLTVL